MTPLSLKSTTSQSNRAQIERFASLPACCRSKYHFRFLFAFTSEGGIDSLCGQGYCSGTYFLRCSSAIIGLPMSTKWPKLLHDSVHHLIAFEESDCDKLLLDLINTREFQRLRRIKQLGFSETVFPGANHSRFAHCIGVLQMARLFLHRLRAVAGTVDENARTIVLCAALLHDLGHGPCSHAF